MCKIDDCYITECGYCTLLNNKKGKLFRRNILLPAKIFNIIRAKNNNTGIFKTVYNYNDINQDKSFLHGDFYMDFDSENFEDVREDVKKALSFLKIVFRINIDRDCNIFYSGNKGIHLIIPYEVLGIDPDKHLNEIFKTIAIDISEFTTNKTLDLRVYDNKRLFRVENSIHEVTLRYKVYLTVDELNNLSEDEIKAIASHAREIPKKDSIISSSGHNMFLKYKEKTDIRVNSFENVKSIGTLKYKPPCICEILENGFVQGQRNNTLAILASYYKASGKDSLTCVNELLDWNMNIPSNPLSKLEVKRTCKSIYSSNKTNFGCSSIKTLDLCSDKKCNFKK